MASRFAEQFLVWQQLRVCLELSMSPDLEPEPQPHSFPLDTLRGVFRVFLLYDVAEEIDLETVRRLGIEAVAKTPSFKHPTPDYVALERPPAAEPIEPFVSDSG
jgi:hypothetical protein